MRAGFLESILSRPWGGWFGNREDLSLVIPRASGVSSKRDARNRPRRLLDSRFRGNDAELANAPLPYCLPRRGHRRSLFPFLQRGNGAPGGARGLRGPLWCPAFPPNTDAPCPNGVCESPIRTGVRDPSPEPLPPPALHRPAADFRIRPPVRWPVLRPRFPACCVIETPHEAPL